jgi:hypothetical protein
MTANVQLKKITGRESQGACRQDALIVFVVTVTVCQSFTLSASYEIIQVSQAGHHIGQVSPLACKDITSSHSAR